MLHSTDLSTPLGLTVTLGPKLLKDGPAGFAGLHLLEPIWTSSHPVQPANLKAASFHQQHCAAVVS